MFLRIGLIFKVINPFQITPVFRNSRWVFEIADPETEMPLMWTYQVDLHVVSSFIKTLIVYTTCVIAFTRRVMDTACTCMSKNNLRDNLANKAYIGDYLCYASFSLDQIKGK